MTDQVVVDASMAVKWVLREPYTEEALELASEWANKGVRPMAPCLLLAEASNTLHRGAVTGQISLSQAEELLQGLLNMGIEVRESPQIHIQALKLAKELQRPDTYDTHYLALAEVLECELWTADERFSNAVKRQKPQVRWLGQFSKEAQ